ncbi:HelD family protein [Yinghuangia soli]|uniref:ATP-binding domain-containing protein n=1 Tax=Yinghuangia soli TaxID=2908204 RepID=A0AA41QAE7_9ACTN|nr:ATP-binding domain-containing protein [Yinghuangia soli]MCF2533157.1 ATP-binding domain-containing protein [Yinghuangia soli]
MAHDDPALADALISERTYHDACRAALDAMVDGAQELVTVGESAFASGADAEVLGYRLRSQAKEFRELPKGPLFFGRVDFEADPQAAGHHAGQAYHVGRVRIAHDPSAPPMVVDWRAPVARMFYQASARDPQGVAVRRRFGWSPASRGDSADLTGLEDEHLGDGEARESSIVAGEIERPRVGPMRDIAATIQPEQDDLVRAELATSVCVQGAPGTGKTAVGLHRAAYLLYTHPQRIRRGGMLILGPNRAFLSYISAVLPALGETGVRQATLEDEIARHPVTAYDSDAAAALKHDARMAEVLHGALYARVTAHAASALVLPDGSYRWRVAEDEVARIIRDVRTEELPYAAGRERVRSRIVRAVEQQAERRAGPRTSTWLQKIARARPLTGLLDAVWPAAHPEAVLADLLGRPETLAAAADGILTPVEQEALAWPRPPRSPRSARWSAADLVLLDELAGLIERPAGYGHIVVDEAQDLSPMQARAIARRSPFASVTVLGDLAQATTPWAARDWPELLAHLGKPDAVVTPLTMGFRIPGPVADLANRVLRHLDADVPPARSLRRDGDLTIEATDDATAATVAAVAAAMGHAGSIGVIAADTESARLRRALGAAGFPASGPDAFGPDAFDSDAFVPDASGPDSLGLDSFGPDSFGPDALNPDSPGTRLTVVPATAAKGLEYDHVVLVEPSSIVDAEARGLNRLYVALTRAVSRLHIVHAAPLPLAMRPHEASPQPAGHQMQAS